MSVAAASVYLPGPSPVIVRVALCFHVENTPMASAAAFLRRQSAEAAQLPRAPTSSTSRPRFWEESWTPRKRTLARFHRRLSRVRGSSRSGAAASPLISVAHERPKRVPSITTRGRPRLIGTAPLGLVPTPVTDGMRPQWRLFQFPGLQHARVAFRRALAASARSKLTRRRSTYRRWEARAGGGTALVSPKSANDILRKKRLYDTVARRWRRLYTDSLFEVVFVRACLFLCPTTELGVQFRRLPPSPPS